MSLHHGSQCASDHHHVPVTLSVEHLGAVEQVEGGIQTDVVELKIMLVLTIHRPRQLLP